MKESTLQIQCVNYLSILCNKHNDLMFFSIPNEHYNISHAQRTTFKKMGLLIGVPDFCILYQGQTLFIEFKKLGEKPNDTQKIIHDKIRKCGHTVSVVDDFDFFKDIIKIYFGVEI